MNHFGEEPPVSGKRGSGAVFFSGCPLRCVYCQNAPVSIGGKGEPYTAPQLANALLTLSQRAENVNLITAGHYLEQLLPVLKEIKPSLGVPVVYNSGGYEKREAIARLNGLCDVYLPDYKYYSSALSEKYSLCPDYRQFAVAAIDEMVRQQDAVETENGLIRRGVIVRHLVLPGCRKDSLAVVRDIADRWKGRVLLSLLWQYTPKFNRSPYRELNRRVTTYEYESVVNEAVKAGLNGFMQQRDSATDEFTPDF